MYKVKQCCHSPSQEPRYCADIGDWVLVIKGVKVFKGQIVSFSTSDSVELRLDDESILMIDGADISAVILED